MIDDELNVKEGVSADVDPICEAAAEWIVRLREADVSAEDVASWQQWMRLDLRHAMAFERIEEMGAQIAELRNSRMRPSPPTRRALAHDSYDGSMPIRLWSKTRRIHSRPWGLSAWTVGAAAAVCFGLAVTVAWHLQTQHYSTLVTTTIGQNRTVRLTDGSRVTLGGDSQLAVTFDSRMRRVALLRGEAYFSVARNPQRPFELTVGHAVLDDIGTSFDVRWTVNRVIVNVLEGRIAVRMRAAHAISAKHRNPTGSATVFLGADEATTVDSNGIESVSQISDPAAVTAWISGQLAFRREPLSQVLERVNRYATKPIVAANPNIAGIEITGTVVERNVSEWIASLRSALGIEADEQPNRIVLRQAPE